MPRLEAGEGDGAVDAVAEGLDERDVEFARRGCAEANASCSCGERNTPPIAHTAKCSSGSSDRTRRSAVSTLCASSPPARTVMCCDTASPSEASRATCSANEATTLTRSSADCRWMYACPRSGHRSSAIGAQPRRGAAPVELAHHGVERFAPDPVAAAGVAHEVAPPVDAGHALRADGEGHDAGAGGDDRAAGVAERPEERRRRVVREDHLAHRRIVDAREELGGIRLLSR